MITKVTPVSELKQLFLEILMNMTNKVTKVSKGSVVSGVAYGVAKVGQKALKDIALVESHLFPSYAFGTHLDDVANELGIASRFGASGSSVYLFLSAIAGTVYDKGTTTFPSTNGI